VSSRIGRAGAAVRDNEAAATAHGRQRHPGQGRRVHHLLGFAGLAGVMTALWLDLVKPDENEFTGTYSLTVAIAFLAVVHHRWAGLGARRGRRVAPWSSGLQQFFLLGSQEFGWFADAAFGGFSAVIVSTFVYGAAIVLVVLFEPGGMAAIGRRLLARRSSTLQPTAVPTADAGGRTTPREDRS
jgi:branched-chain amino acid transport system permease protein